MLQITSIAAVAVLFLQKKTRNHEKRKHQRHHRRKPPPHSPSNRQLRPNQRSRMHRRTNRRQAPRRQGSACARHHDRRPQLPQTNVGTRLQPATPTPRLRVLVRHVCHRQRQIRLCRRASAPQPTTTHHRRRP